MGGGISYNYTNIHEIFQLGCWKVHSAIHKPTNEPVSLWSIDYPFLKTKERVKKERRNYLAHSFKCIQLMRKITHQNILQIREVSDISKELAFAAEPVKWHFTAEKEFSKDESLYITLQLAFVMKYLHETCHIALLSLCPDNIVFSPSFDLKIGIFLHAIGCPDDATLLQDPFNKWHPSMFHVPACYCAPEVIADNGFRRSADVFMYALIAAESFTHKPLITAQSASDYNTSALTQNLEGVPEEFFLLFKQCLSLTPEARPRFVDIMDHEAFTSVVCGVFMYLNTIGSSVEQDRYTFYSGLLKIIDIFSFRMIENKFLPLFIRQTISNNLFGIVLVPMIFKIGVKLDKKEFIPKILQPIHSVLTCIRPFQINQFLISQIPFLIDVVPPEQHKTYVYPIIFASISTDENSLAQKAMEVIPLLIDNMDNECVESTLLPKLTEALMRTNDPKNAASALNCISLCCPKIQGKEIVQNIFPAIRKMWDNHKWTEIAEPVIMIIESITLEPSELLLYVIPLISLIVENQKIPHKIQKRYFNLIEQIVKDIRYIRGIQRIENYTPVTTSATVQANNPFDSTVNSTDDEAVDPMKPKKKKQQQQVPPASPITKSHSDHAFQQDPTQIAAEEEEEEEEIAIPTPQQPAPQQATQAHHHAQKPAPVFGFPSPAPAQSNALTPQDSTSHRNSVQPQAVFGNRNNQSLGGSQPQFNINAAPPPNPNPSPITAQQSPFNQNDIFGTQPSKPMPPPQPADDIFGLPSKPQQPVQPSPYGQPAPFQSSNMFGEPTRPAQQSNPFMANAPPPASSPANDIFGMAPNRPSQTAQPSPFMQAPPPATPPANDIFGMPPNRPSQPAPQQSPFIQAPAPSPANDIFGAPPNQQFNNQRPPQQNVFAMPQQAQAPQANPFGQPAPRQAPQQSPFGATPQQTQNRPQQNRGSNFFDANELDFDD